MEELAVKSGMDLRWRTGDTIYECQSNGPRGCIRKQSTSRCIHTMDGRTLRSRATSHLGISSVVWRRARRWRREGANVLDRDSCEGAMEFWWVFGMNCRF